MKFIAVADVHLGYKLYNIPELEQDLKDAFVRVVELAIANKVDYFVTVGDLFEHNKPTPDLVQFVEVAVRRMGSASNGIRVIGISGDHDKPIEGASWAAICGIDDPSAYSEFIGLSYSDTPGEVLEKLKRHQNKETAEWVFLHGQVPEIFKFATDKKLLNLSSLDLKQFPELRGFVLGDIHASVDRQMTEAGHKNNPIKLSYCGSLGIVKTDEIGGKRGVLFFDGNELKRLPFPMEREFVRIKFMKEGGDLQSESYYREYSRTLKKKPVFLVEYDSTTERDLKKLDFLYDIGIVVASRVITLEDGSTDHINIRADLATNETRMEAALLTTFKEKGKPFELAQTLLSTTEIKDTLDAFKNSCFTKKEQVCRQNQATPSQ